MPGRCFPPAFHHAQTENLCHDRMLLPQHFGKLGRVGGQEVFGERRQVEIETVFGSLAHIGREAVDPVQQMVAQELPLGAQLALGPASSPARSASTARPHSSAMKASSTARWSSGSLKPGFFAKPAPRYTCSTSA